MRDFPPGQNDLDRFIVAQRHTFSVVCDQLEAGKKSGQWMWFIFPQLRGLDRSPQADFYGIGSLTEAQAFLRHPVLGPRLAHCTKLVLNAEKLRTVHDIFSATDVGKFHSSMTLFCIADGRSTGPQYRAIKKFFAGLSDNKTVRMLKNGSVLDYIRSCRRPGAKRAFWGFFKSRVLDLDSIS